MRCINNIFRADFQVYIRVKLGNAPTSHSPELRSSCASPALGFRPSRRKWNSLLEEAEILDQAWFGRCCCCCFCGDCVAQRSAGCRGSCTVAETRARFSWDLELRTTIRLLWLSWDSEADGRSRAGSRRFSWNSEPAADTSGELFCYTLFKF